MTRWPPVGPAASVRLASTGFAANLLQQERLMRLTPDDLSGHALSLHSAGMLTLQGASATLAGTVAQLTSPATAMTVMSLASLTVTTLLAKANGADVIPVLPIRTNRNGD